jgi:plasmid stability protein
VSLTRRTQILLDEQRYHELRARARADGVSVGAFVRDAVDRALAEDRRAGSRRAAEAFLDSEPFPVGEPEELEQELDASYERGEP